jgi:NADH:ubiquinone oxidoreductase subunit 4 (subunit M)
MNLIMFLFIFLKNFNNNILNLFLLVHGVLSAFLFYLVDQVQKQTGTRNLTAISGLSNSSSILHIYI